MAIDTAEKRASISGIHFISGPGVTPNSAQDQEWRQESGYGYSGILAGGASVSTSRRTIFAGSFAMGKAPIHTRIGRREIHPG